MFKLRLGYLGAGIATGLVLLFSFVWTLPDGKLHIIFCNVGQGDASYIRFPDGRDMLIDGGPDDKVIACLGRHMPFWDRQINLVVLSHPQKDHLQGLISVFKRYQIDYFVRSDVSNKTEGYEDLIRTADQKKVPTKFVTAGETIAVGSTSLSFLWPNETQIAKGKSFARSDLVQRGPTSPVLGAASVGEMNDYSVVFLLRYGSFDALFPGDADKHVESRYVGAPLADNDLELLKVPHHGSRTGMTEEFVKWFHPSLAIISVGKNSYGQPNSEALELLANIGGRVLRTDENGDIEVVSEGKNWEVKTEKLTTSSR